MLPNVAPEAVAQARINYDAETKEFERSLWRNFRICQDLHTEVEKIFRAGYSRYVALDICDEEKAYKPRVLWGKCRVCYTNADREFHFAAEQIPVNGNLYTAYCAAAKHEEQCDELMQLMKEVDPWSGGSSSSRSEESDFEVATATGDSPRSMCPSSVAGFRTG